VGIATAQGLASALGIPVVAGTSLDALALEAATAHRHIFSIVDVRRGELAVATYRPVPGGVVRDAPPDLLSMEGLRAALMSDPGNPLVVGDVPTLASPVLRGLHRVRTGRPRFPSGKKRILDVDFSG
jgi:tRNA A37 threonylcarbamoyladenosine modification protein TsaB